jgi:hypothetical protein
VAVPVWLVMFAPRVVGIGAGDRAGGAGEQPRGAELVLHVVGGGASGGDGPDGQTAGSVQVAGGVGGQHERDAAGGVAARPVNEQRIITIAIVGDWTGPTIKSLSLLSRLALRTAAQKLGDLGYLVRFMLIEREVRTSTPR